MVTRYRAVVVTLVTAGVLTAGFAALPGITSAQAPPGPIFEPIAVGVANVLQNTKYTKGPTTLDFRKATIPVGGVVPWHCHPGPTTFIVVQGELTTFAPDGTTLVLGPGDADVEAVGIARQSQNLGTEDVVVYIAFAPPEGQLPTIWLTGPNDKCPM
jgi:quercetin dioxygenase-like cupin family protein